MANGDTIAVDSSILIDMIDGKSNVARAMQPLVEDAEKGQCRLIFSEVTVAEVVHLGGEDSEKLGSLLDGFLSQKYARAYPVTRSISQRASEIIRLARLDTCDAIIAATAIVHNADVLYANDRSMRKKLRKSQCTPTEAPSHVLGVALRSPLYDEDLCKRAGLKFGEPYCRDLSAVPSASVGVQSEPPANARDDSTSE